MIAKFVIIFTFLVVLLPQISLACSCAPDASVGFNLKASDFIFTGEVLKSKEKIVGYDRQIVNGKKTKIKETNTIYSFNVFEVFKGEITKKVIEVNAGDIYTSCRGGFQVGISYLVYASGKNENKLSASTACGDSKNTSWAENEIYFIKKFVKGEPEPQVYGRAWFWKLDEIKGEYQKVFPPNLKVVIKSKENQFETLTNDSGVYVFNYIPTGKYRIELIAPEGFRHLGLIDNSFFIFPNKRVGRYDSMGFYDYEKMGSKELESLTSDLPFYIQNSYFGSFFLSRDNNIKGKVFDANGKTIKYASVGLVPAQTPDRAISYQSAEELWNDAYYCGNEPPGKYLLAFEVNSFDQNGKLKRFFYPETTQPEKAKVFDIKPTDKLSLDLRVPLATREIKGEILWDDGTKINENISIFLTKNKKFDWQDRLYLNYLEEKSLDETNQFSLQVFENNEFWLHVFVDGGSLEVNIETQSKPQKVKVEKNDVELKILIPKPDILQKSN